MNKYINITLAFLVMLLISCGHDVEKIDNQNYTPPSVKYKPRLLYPKTAQENAYAGNPKLMISISKTGKVDKVELSKSSGYDVLDNAAFAFCKDMLFNPATRYGKPIYSKMEWEIKFNFFEQPWNANKYVQEVEYLYKAYEYSSSFGRYKILQEILEKHNEFILNMKDGINFNYYIERVISQNISAEWKRDWNAWPISFLLFHDFINRFPNYDSLANVKRQLSNALKIDIQYINNMPANTAEIKEAKDYILFRINRFFKDNYPGILIDTSGLNEGNVPKPIS